MTGHHEPSRNPPRPRVISMREIRQYAIPLQFRGGGDGRTVGGLVVPYGTPTEIREMGGTYTEVFRAGAFAKSIAERGSKTKLLAAHQRDRLPIGKASALVETADGLLGEFYVSRTQAGDDALELIRDGALDAFSVGFEPIRDEWSRDRSSVERVEARLWEVSLVTIPAYEDALVSSVRSDSDPEVVEEEETSESEEESEDEDVDSRERRLIYWRQMTAGYDAYIQRLAKGENR